MKHKLTLSLLLMLTVSAAMVLTASAAGDYGMDRWTVDGGGATFSTGGSYSLGSTIGQPEAGPPMSGGSYNLTGGFWPSAAGVPPAEYTLTITSDHGTVTPDPLPPYHDGDMVELNATADAGWWFHDWSGDVISTDNPVTITMDSDKSVTANYGAATYSLSGNAGTADATLTYTGGTTTADGGGIYTISVPYDWSGTVTPFKVDTSFQPVRHSYSHVMADLVDQDFAAGAKLFADVPFPGKEWMQPWIEQFYYAGVTAGCGVGPLVYCPENNVTRAEMAVFILRAMHGPGYVPPAATGVFADVPFPGKEWMQPWIEDFFAHGITSGCGISPLIYCPERQVTRAEMAVFVLRAIHTLPYTPPTPTGIFSDVPVAGKEWMQAWIEDFYGHGITSGCAVGPLRYCPENNTTRAEMAVFIGRAFGLMP
jgi:hypothetical protein